MSETDVVDVLRTDHREFVELIEEIRASSDPVERRDLADSLIGGLVRHSVSEEMHVYPAMRDHLPHGREAVEHDTREHKELEALMRRLEGADASAPEFLEVLGEISTTLQDHITDEEGEQFPLLRAHLPVEQLVQLKEEVEATKRIAPTRPHPLSPNSALFHTLVGPGVGLVDRLRDRLTGRDA
jgi:hemerythrin superfamily protein